ncbi:GNAT family N-acetyltransferase [Variovorax sp. WS11]|uniref:GNAT family N-acetyltransferase n=1 Tax=Variovorax sp. WS11 TaxID=1105204 RepID=UPI000D0C98E5|nr:GNAT family N-acetyltransferase [Variovorax sp. WS11]NDZ11652.1 N-acetyltransferase [Variovorax sp. WS11]PSL86513.1 GNAT family N-acetyltransferase [Variovorax sp. WS11]
MTDPVVRIHGAASEIDAAAWDSLLAAQAAPSPFMRHAYLDAMEQSDSASPQSGWAPRFLTLWRGRELMAACPMYLKGHSYGEYVFDWAWANAYQQHGLAYYPKAVVAVPFTPVPGTRLLARDAASRALLVQALVAWCKEEELSSLHLLFGADEDIEACADAGLMLRHTVQFHWKNVAPKLGTDVSSLPPEGARFALGRPGGEMAPTLGTDVSSLPPEGARFALGRPGGETSWSDFEAFLASLSHDKRKKIRQERRKVHDAGVRFRWSRGADIREADWAFFYRCYARTYREHGNPPYLKPEFFGRMAEDLPEAWLLFIAERGGKPIASSLIALSADASVAYGRYWGALERVDCLHFEACYYQPLAWCIEHGVQRFEGGAQGEHKMARALMPAKTTSAHWLAHPAFADAVERFLEREDEGIANYLDHLGERSPFRHAE